jgi:hypothetical protein
MLLKQCLISSLQIQIATLKLIMHSAMLTARCQQHHAPGMLSIRHDQISRLIHFISSFVSRRSPRN